MCRKLALLATVLAMALAPALVATAAATSSAPPAVASPSAPAAAQPKQSPKATPEERAEAERLDPLARAAFWAHVVDNDPRDTDAGVKLAKALRALNRFDEAAAAADQVLVIEPNNLEALLESARARVAAGQGFYAIDPAERAEALAPRDWRPVSLLAIGLEQSDRDAEALAAHQKALAMAPGNPAVMSNLGMYYATHGDTAKAEPLLRKAADSPDATAQERQNLALVLGMEGKFDEAAELQRRDLPPDQVNNNLAYLKGAAATPPSTRSWQGVGAVQ
jgi:Flp pilus assembly protein TadD